MYFTKYNASSIHDFQKIIKIPQLYNDNADHPNFNSWLMHNKNGFTDIVSQSKTENRELVAKI